jgi:hypothetical protein
MANAHVYRTSSPVSQHLHPVLEVLLVLPQGTCVGITIMSLVEEVPFTAGDQTTAVKLVLRI